ncbi:MAG: hypothetical protein B7Y90_08150 [Alphaproteobacteria bacterium 32-64-14]|nr:MAG: hypothetical protein B7Y90_08150 [Alphaproteobacteria bacterium 32-64-14]
MGPIILVFIVALLIVLLARPALRERFGRRPPPDDPIEAEPHEVVVRQLDDHRKAKTPGDDAPKG